MGNNGNRKTKISPCGTIEYIYDAMGNLLTEENKNKTVKYAYDAFGRRVLVQDKSEAAIRTLYDGLTFDIIKQGPTFANGQFTDSGSGIKFSSTGRPTGDRYRYLGDEDKKDGSRYFYLDEGTYKNVSSRYRGERTTINVNGTLAAQTTTEGTDYFSTDLLGSIRSTTDVYGAQKSNYTYDAFGTLIQGSLNGTTDHGYLGKQYESTSRLYNYGYRDYKPQTARFTTLDPIRDGSNWFSYCNEDPLNFVDLLGLEVGDKLAEVTNGVATPIGDTWDDAKDVTSTFSPDRPEMEAADGTKTLYGHQSKIIVNKGNKVKAGQKIGEVGNTVKVGPSLNGGGSHLHLSWDGNKDGKFDKNTKQDNPAHLLYSGE